jgi:uncharacterized protein YcgI (DUF1989 family)
MPNKRPPAPADADKRRAARPIIAYHVDALPPLDWGLYKRARATLHNIDEVIVPPRDARAFRVPKGHFLRIVSIEGPQVGDLNLWNAHDLSERFFSGKTRALHATHLAAATGLSIDDAEPHVHDVLNVFMCTGFTPDTHQYFMKASPVRPGDFLELFAEIDLLCALSTCPGGDCGATHSSDAAACYPLAVEIFRTDPETLAGWHEPARNAYSGRHGS